MAKGRTILMVEHNMKAVSSIADRITVLQRGPVLAEGSYQEVSNNPLVIEAYMSTMALEVKNLESWYGESHILHGVNFVVRDGEVVTLLGRNGAGRSTILKTILGLTSKRTGSVQVYGTETISMSTYKIARLGVGFCPEERGIFASLSTEENLLLLPEIAPGGMGLDKIYEMFPNLYERRNSPGTRLSGGEQQMLAMARMLRTGAKLLLLDEITEGLAPVIVQKLGEAVTSLCNKGFTIVLVEQNFRFAAPLADRHYVVEHENVVEVVNQNGLTEKAALLNEYLGI
ncbi:ATP-binding cassette domain-containing protein [Polynucleobacter necessarius]|uniref:ABC transporter ATP-binding protein n=1 Tax=Polynucleobacter necessarius TaxID=576610 RepID=UPI0039E23863